VIELTPSGIDQIEHPLVRRIAKTMRKEGLNSLVEFADAHDLARTTVYNLVYGRTGKSGKVLKPGLDTLVRLADALDTPAHVLLYELEPDAFGAESVDLAPGQMPVRKVLVDVAGFVGAGPAQNVEVFSDLWVDKRIIGSRRVAGYQVLGNSMDAGKKPILSGSIVLVDLDSPGQDGSVVVALLKNGGHVCKIRRGSDLFSANPDSQEPFSIPGSSIEHVMGEYLYHFPPLP
jgi:repressor LexA